MMPLMLVLGLLAIAGLLQATRQVLRSPTILTTHRRFRVHPGATSTRSWRSAC